MRFIKKVSSTPLSQAEGHIIDSFNTSDDHTTNAPSLNAVENNVVMKPTVLYEGGTLGTITLSDSVDNYEYIEIFHGKARPEFSTKIIPSESQYATLFNYTALSSGPQVLLKKVGVSGTSITHSSGYYINFTSSGLSSGSTNEIYIYRVLGYK